MKELKPGDPCPLCNHAGLYPWRILRQSGKARPKDLICVICGKLWDSETGEPLPVKSHSEQGKSGPGGTFHTPHSGWVK